MYSKIYNSIMFDTIKPIVNSYLGPGVITSYLDTGSFRHIFFQMHKDKFFSSEDNLFHLCLLLYAGR